MLFVGRPLTLLALAVCTYVVLSWRYKTSLLPAASSIHYEYDANGFRKFDPSKETQKGGAPLASPVDERKKLPQVTVTVSATSSRKEATNTYTASEDLPLPTLDPIDMEEYTKDVLHWNRPGHVDGHFPDYEKFENSDYDPNRWEGFEL